MRTGTDVEVIPPTLEEFYLAKLERTKTGAKLAALASERCCFSEGFFENYRDRPLEQTLSMMAIAIMSIYEFGQQDMADVLATFGRELAALEKETAAPPMKRVILVATIN